MRSIGTAESEVTAMRVRRLLLAGVAVVAASCAGPAGPGSLDTGLAGIVMRGPVQPVCMVGVSCDAPFAATFGVYAGGEQVATFQSDAQGRFDVPLAPGVYLVVPGPGAPVIFPSSQARQVTVGPVGLTTVQLLFDTGIR
jgi:hypothetical protein